MQFRLAIKGDLRAHTKLIGDAGKRAVTNGIKRTVTLEKNALRKEVAGAGLGDKLGNALRGRTFPEQGYSLSARGWIDSKAIYKRPSGFVDLFTVLREGASIKGSPYLAIPLVHIQSPKDGRRQAHPSDFPAGTFGIRPSRRPGVFLLFWKNRPDDEVFVLFRTTKVRKRINFQALHDRYTAGLDARIAAEWEKEIARAGSKISAGAA